MESIVNSLLVLAIGGLTGLLYNKNPKIGRQYTLFIIVCFTIIFVSIISFKLGQLQNDLTNRDQITIIRKEWKFIADNILYLFIYLLSIGILIILYFLSIKLEKLKNVVT